MKKLLDISDSSEDNIIKKSNKRISLLKNKKIIKKEIINKNKNEIEQEICFFDKMIMKNEKDKKKYKENKIKLLKEDWKLNAYKNEFIKDNDENEKFISFIKNKNTYGF